MCVIIRGNQNRYNIPNRQGWDVFNGGGHHCHCNLPIKTWFWQSSRDCAHNLDAMLVQPCRCCDDDRENHGSQRGKYLDILQPPAKSDKSQFKWATNADASDREEWSLLQCNTVYCHPTDYRCESPLFTVLSIDNLASMSWMQGAMSVCHHPRGAISLAATMTTLEVRGLEKKASCVLISKAAQTHMLAQLAL